MGSLTIFLAPIGVGDGVQAVLTDLSAAGLLEPFIWITQPSLTAQTQIMTQVKDGTSTDITVADIVSGPRLDVLRICVLVPLLGADEALRVDQERSVTEFLTSTLGAARVVRVRCGLARAQASWPPSAVVAVEGWHNIVVSPEDGRGPGLGHIQLPATTDPIDVGRHSAPVIAGLLGLWKNITHNPLDDSPALPGAVVRLARSYYRQIQAGGAETLLHRQLLAQNGTLPLPSDQRAQVVHVQDVSLAAGSMAEKLWNKHDSVLRGPRQSYDTHTPEKIGLGAAIRMFFGFLWAAIKNAPAAWYAQIIDSVSTTVAASLNKTMFGDGSAYEVVVNGRTANGARVDWTTIADASSQLRSALASGPGTESHTARSDLSGLWLDYSRAALTLADAGARTSELPPVQVGANRGIIATAANIIPGPRECFTEIPGVIAANIDIVTVDSTDPMGITSLRDKLSDLEGTREHGVQARTTLTALSTWQRKHGHSFGVQVGRRLAEAFGTTYFEVGELLTKLSSPPDLGPQPTGNNRLARWVQITALVLIIVTATVTYLVIDDRLRWWWAPVIIGAACISGFALCLRAFLRAQQEMFQLINKRTSLRNEREVDHQNLGAALRDLSRLSQAYGEYLAWSRALGAFLASPLGSDQRRTHESVPVSWGLPMSTAIAVATPDDGEVSSAVTYLRRDLFNPGWLSGPWTTLVHAAVSPASGDGDPPAESSPLWFQPGRASGSTLDQWSSELFDGHRQSSGAEGVWRRAQQMLRGPMSELADTLVGRIHVPGASPIPATEFLGGVDRPATPTGYFDRALLTDLAVTSGAGAVSADHRTTARHGIGTICVATQLTDAFPVDYLAGAAWGTADRPGSGSHGDGRGDNGQAYNRDGQQPAAQPDHYQPPSLGEGFKF